MDTVDYTDAGARQMKGIRHLSNWQLIIPLLLLTSYTACDISTPSSVPELADSNKQAKNLSTCTGETASFTWAYEIQPFIAVEWLFENTLIAQTFEESFSQDDIIITPEYTDRFQLQTKGKVGFNLTDVTKSDTGTYSCIVTLESTDIPKELTAKLQITAGQSGSHRRKRRTLDEQLVPCDGYTDSGNLDDSSPLTTGIVVAVVFAVIAGIAIIAILTVVTWKLKSRAGRRSDSFKVETPASTECLELVDKTHQPEEKREGELEELKDSKRLQDKETCEHVNLNQTT